MRRSLLLLLPALAALSTPAVAGEPIEVSLVNVNGLGFTRAGMEIDLVGEITRRGRLALTLRSIDYTIYVNDEVVGQGEADPNVKIRSGESEEVELPCDLNLSAGVLGVTSMLQSGEMNLRVEGEARVRVLIFPRKVKFETQLLNL